ncbi:ROK family protein [Lentisphaerota bacterium ZTH]|nr:ROK family protein [Lentisphaerota bacterium]WET05991.1 ROK family protein [Lentisphaerota bacterium ZTH]
MTVPTGEQALKLEEKRNQFLALIRKTPGISRQECAREMRVSTFYASRLVPELIAEGMVIEAETNEPAAGRGRPSKPLHLNPEYEYFAGIDLQADHWRFVIIDFQGNPKFTLCQRYQACNTREEYIEQLGNLFTEALESVKDIWPKVSALGVGVPTLFDKESGIINNYEILPNFKNIPVLDIYRMATGKPVFMSQGIFNLATFDLWKRPLTCTKTVMLTAQQAGVSSALIANGKVICGSGMKAGQTGLYGVANKQFLKDVSGLHAIADSLPKMPDGFWKGEADAIKEALRKPNIKRVIHGAMDNLAMAMVNIAAFTAPDEVVISSPLLNGENAIWKYFVQKFNQFREEQGLDQLSPQIADKSEFNAAIGAGLFALENQYPCCE